jgi:hypothetical protein
MATPHAPTVTATTMNSTVLRTIEETLPYNCSTPKNYVKWAVLVTRIKKGINAGSLILDQIRRDIIKQEDVGKFTDEHYSAVAVALPILFKVPPICVHENILDSLLQTAVKEMDAPDRSLPGYIFLLPLKANKFLENFKTKDNNQLNIDSIFVDVTGVKGKYFHVVFLTKDKVHYRYYSWDKTGYYSNFLNSNIETEIFLERLVKNLILIYTYETKQITEEQVKVTTPGKGFTKDKEDKNKDMASPIRWLGKAFVRQQTKYLYAANKSENNSRTVASHWRRGHWHTVCCGPKRKQRKQQWFKPVFINTNTD